ncbi:MAG: YkgJ family cysteine cluster protein [Gammaproteobacteria bacterium]|jgi:Fe-S-cluster containining protein
MECRVGCGACCIAPSITSPIPGMSNGKPAGIRCSQLDDGNRCLLFGNPNRPAVCMSFKASEDVCGGNFEEALINITRLERLTSATL